MVLKFFPISLFPSFFMKSSYFRNNSFTLNIPFYQQEKMEQGLARNKRYFGIHIIILVICLNNLIIQLDAEIIVTNQGAFSNPSIISLYNPTNLQRKNLQNIFNQQQFSTNNNNKQVGRQIKSKDGQQLKSQVTNKPINYPNQNSINTQFLDAYGGLTLFNLANTFFSPKQNNQIVNSQANLKSQTIPIFPPQQINNDKPFNFFNVQTQAGKPLIQMKPQSLSSNKMMDNIDLVSFETQLNKAKKQANFQIFDIPLIQSTKIIEPKNPFPKTQFPQNPIKQIDSSFPSINSQPIQYDTVMPDLQKSINERFNNFFPV